MPDNVEDRVFTRNPAKKLRLSFVTVNGNFIGPYELKREHTNWFEVDADGESMFIRKEWMETFTIRKD